MELCFADVPKILPLPQPEGRFHLLWQALDSDVIQFGTTEMKYGAFSKSHQRVNCFMYLYFGVCSPQRDVIFGVGSYLWLVRSAVRWFLIRSNKSLGVRLVCVRWNYGLLK